MIILHQFRRKLGLPNVSLFCMKVEAWLRMANLDYEVQFQDDPRKAPLGKLPLIEDDGVLIPDSTLIIDHLEEHHGIDLDASLSKSEKAISHAFQRMIEERLYWACVYDRWLGANAKVVIDAALGGLPSVMRHVVSRMLQRKLKRDLEGHGLGRHNEATIYEFACRDIEALADYLEDKPYLMGDEATTVDATLLAVLSGLLAPALAGTLQDKVMCYPHLVSYQARLGKRYFPEFF